VHIEDPVLRIDRVEASGAIGQFNRDNPNDALAVNDCIVAVNGVRGNSYKMLLECKNTEALDLEVRPCTREERATMSTTVTVTSSSHTTLTTTALPSTSTKTTTQGCPACAPKFKDNLDVAIPFFERDLCKLKYTAKSISKFDPNHFLGNVYLMWVSVEPFWKYQKEIDEIKDLISQTRQVFLLDFSQKMRDANIPGWHAQQIVKLKVASRIGSDFYLVLDSKNTFIRQITADTFFTKCNQGRIQAEFPGDGIPSYHRDWYNRSAAALGVDPPADGYWPGSITPVVIHKQLVLDILDHIGEQASTDALCAGPLCELMGAHSGNGKGATEFTMYTLWAYQMTNLECHHAIDVLSPVRVEYSADWRQKLVSELGLRDVHGEEELNQVIVRDRWFHPLHVRWLSTDLNRTIFPLQAQDVVLRWAQSLWRGEPKHPSTMENINLKVLKSARAGSPNQPLMFGSQTGAMNTLDKSDWNRRQKARGDLVAVYQDAQLYDPATMGSTEELVSCVVGAWPWHASG
jgi:hypothetical protein